MRLLPAFALALAATPALAGTEDVIDRQILPGYAAFSEAADALADAARVDCTAPALRPAYQAAFDAWMGDSHVLIGPAEDEGRALAIAFWPDTRGLTGKTLRGLIAERDPVVESAQDFADVTVAARGFFALERMLYGDVSDYPAGSYSCDLTVAITADLARMAHEIEAGWRRGYADTMREAGADGNRIYLSELEASQALFTLLTSALEFDADKRVGRPLGKRGDPRPRRAEAWRSNRSLRNVVLSLEALRDLASLLSEAPPARTLAAFDAALGTARGLDDPAFAGVATPEGWDKVHALHRDIDAIRQAVRQEVGPQLGVAPGFNAADGD